MSSNCPPQLQLSIQPNTTSFKRSFEQFGFDLESPVVTDAGATAGASDGRNERNKRARSASSFESETSSDLSSDTIASTSSSGSSAISEGGAVGAFAVPTSIEPPRLPTPEIQDVEMPDYPAGEPLEVEREELSGSEQYRLSLARFNDFDNEIATLRQPPSTTTAPPMLPPLRHRLLQDAFFRHNESSGSRFSSAFFDEPHPSTNNSDSPPSLTQHSEADDTIQSAVPQNPHFDLFRESQPFTPLALSILNPATPTDPPPTPGFRGRLDSALERLRSPSPLVPGLEDDQDQRDDEDGDEEEEEEEEEGEQEDEPMSERETEQETEDLVAGNAIHELPPTLPPIRSVENLLTDQPAASTSQSVPPNPPILPPIPAIASDVVIDAAERAWHGRFDDHDFIGLPMNFNSAPVHDHFSPSPPQPPSDVRETVTSTSPRPFSRSARPMSVSSRTPSAFQPVTTNPSLDDHPLPSPILRDLHSWLEERQPSLSNTAIHNFALLHADDASSVSSISTAAATAGTERDASTSHTISTSLSYMLNRTRTDGRVEDWAGNGTRRPWLSPAASASTPPAEPDGTPPLRGALPWYTGDASPELAFGAANHPRAAASAASRPISTTPAPVENPVIGYGEDSVFTFGPPWAGATFASTQNPASPSTSGGSQQWGSVHQEDEEPERTTELDSSMNAPGDRPSDSGVNTNSISTSSLARVEAGSPSTSSSYFNHVTRPSTDAGRTINSADASNNVDRHGSDPATAIWDPLELSELPLHLGFNSTSNSNANARTRSSLIYTPSYLDGPSSFDSPAIHDGSYTYGRSPLNRDTPEPYVANWTPALPGTNPMTNLARAEHRRASERHASSVRQEETLAMREMFDMTENTRPQPTLAPSSLRNWNGRSTEEDRPQTQSQIPSRQSPATHAEATTSAVSTRNSEISSAIEPRRTDPRLRHRLLRSSSSQMRLGSSNSLVTENASELRRRADHEDMRRLPGERYSSFGLNVDDHSTESTDGTGQSERPRLRSSWEEMLLNRAWGVRRRRPSVTSERPDPPMPGRTSSPSIPDYFDVDIIGSSVFPSLTTFVDGLNPNTRGATTGNTNEPPRESQPPTPISGRQSDLISQVHDIWETVQAEGGLLGLGGDTDASQPPHHDAPSLPPPDLGSTFNAGHHSRSYSSIDDPMGVSVGPAAPEMLHINNTNERPNNVTQGSHGRLSSFLSSVISPTDRQVADSGQQPERPTIHQTTSEERIRRLHLDRRMQEDRRRVASAIFHARHAVPIDLYNSRTSTPLTGSGARATSPTPASPTVPPAASASGVPRPSLSELRRPSMGGHDHFGRPSLFDPSTFAAGPFRNTLQHYVNEREGLAAPRSEFYATRSPIRRPPPYIPPLPFDSDNEHVISSPRQADDITERIRHRAVPNQTSREGVETNGPSTRRAPRIIRELPFESHPPSRTSPQDDYDPYFSGPRTASPTVANENTSSNGPNGSRRPSDNSRSLNMHRYLTEQARMEGSRLEDPLHPLSNPRNFSSMIEPLRPDNPGANVIRSAHLMERYHRERELARRTEDEEDIVPPGESRARNRRRLFRAQQEAVMSFTRVSGASMSAGWRRGRALGDFMRDEDFDDSYENLLSLSMQIGDAKPRATPSEILEKMEKGIYKDWATEGSDTRCPICLDDYAPTDPVQKLSNCPHWLHQECLSQWLQSATTCPVCRESVNTVPSSPFGAPRLPRYRAMHPFSLSIPRRRRELSPPANNNPSSPTSQSPNTNSRDTNNRNGSPGNNRPQDSPSRGPFPASWRFRPA